jgi:hypothetical protein
MDKFKGHNSSKNSLIATIFNLDLQVLDIKPYTKFQCNSCTNGGKNPENIFDGLTDIQMGINPIVSSSYTQSGRGQ